MKIFISALIVFLGLYGNAFSQVGMTGNAPHQSAALDINSTNKGLLIPQVSLTSTTSGAPIAGGVPGVGLLVYNTNSGITGIGAADVGYYYWNSTQWIKLVTTMDVSSGWSTTGNAGTIAGTNYVGTGDANDFVLGTNGADRVHVTTSGNVGIGTSTPGNNLEVSGTTKVVDNLFLGSTALAPASGTAQLVRNNTTGEVYQVQSSTGGTNPIAYAKYHMTNVYDDLITGVDTKIPISDYTVAVVGAAMTTADPNTIGMSANYGGSLSPYSVSAIQYLGNWVLIADYIGGAPAAPSYSTWDLYCLIINNSLVKTLNNITANCGGSQGGSAPVPSDL